MVSSRTFASALVATAVSWGASPAWAAPGGATGQRSFLRILASPSLNSKARLDAATIRFINQGLPILPTRRPPPIPLAVRMATRAQIERRRQVILNYFYRRSLRQGGHAFGGVFQPGGTPYVPAKPINIFTYFPVFRV